MNIGNILMYLMCCQVSLTWLPVTMDPEVVRESARQATPEDIDAKVGGGMVVFLLMMMMRPHMGTFLLSFIPSKLN